MSLPLLFSSSNHNKMTHQMCFYIQWFKISTILYFLLMWGGGHLGLVLWQSLPTYSLRTNAGLFCLSTPKNQNPPSNFSMYLSGHRKSIYDPTKKLGQIQTKLGGWVGFLITTNFFHFGEDPDPDTRIFKFS